MWRTTDADYGVTYGGCTAAIHTASSYRHPDPSAGRYGASSDRNNSSCGNQAGSHRNAGARSHRNACTRAY